MTFEAAAVSWDASPTEYNHVTFEVNHILQNIPTSTSWNREATMFRIAHNSGDAAVRHREEC